MLLTVQHDHQEPFLAAKDADWHMQEGWWTLFVSVDCSLAPSILAYAAGVWQIRKLSVDNSMPERLQYLQRLSCPSMSSHTVLFMVCPTCL